MKLQQLFAGQGLDWKRTKLLRHNLTNELVAQNYEKGFIEHYQSVQSPTRFQNCDTILSFLGTEGTNGVYIGCYRVGNSVAFDKSILPDGFVTDSGMEKDVIYSLSPMDVLPELKNRLVIDWGRGTNNWCHNGTTGKEIIEIKTGKIRNSLYKL